MTETNANDKILKVLKKMDEVLSRNGYFEFQERFHRITKSLLSFERLENLSVSKFSLFAQEEDTMKEEDSTRLSDFNESSLFSSKYSSILQENKIEIENEDKSVTMMELDDLLSYIEEQLNIKNLKRRKEGSGEISSSSSEENSLGKKEKLKPQGSSEKMEQKFFNIKRKLIEYLKQESLFTNKKSPENVLGELTPVNKLRIKKKRTNSITSYLPTLGTNFFEDKKISEKARKRFSVREEEIRNQLARLGFGDEPTRPKSNNVKLSNQPCSIKSEIPSFSSDSKSQNSKTSSEASSPIYNRLSVNFSKRDSIFKERFIYDFSIREEKLDEVLESSDSDH
jgi:hypothetical protein